MKSRTQQAEMQDKEVNKVDEAKKSIANLHQDNTTLVDAIRALNHPWIVD